MLFELTLGENEANDFRINCTSVYASFLTVFETLSIHFLQIILISYF